MKRLNLTGASAMVAAVAALAGYATPAAAQQSAQTFRACLVPQVGAMYLIGLEGLPDECLSGEHREISWTEGGSPEAASVNTDALQDASVTTAKIASGAVSTAQIAPSAVTGTQVAVNAITTAKIASGAVTNSDIANNAITQSKIAPESVSGAELSDGSVDGRVLALELETILETFDIRARFGDNLPSGGSFTVECPSGKEVLSGGFEFVQSSEGLLATSSRPRTGRSVDNGWIVTVRNYGTSAGIVRVHVVCADLR